MLISICRFSQKKQNQWNFNDVLLFGHWISEQKSTTKRSKNGIRKWDTTWNSLPKCWSKWSTPQSQNHILTFHRDRQIIVFLRGINFTGRGTAFNDTTSWECNGLDERGDGRWERKDDWRKREKHFLVYERLFLQCTSASNPRLRTTSANDTLSCLLLNVGHGIACTYSPYANAKQQTVNANA